MSIFVLNQFRYIDFLLNFPEGRKTEDSFCFSVSQGHVICFPHPHLLITAKLWEAWELPLSSWPSHSGGKSNGMDYFGSWESFPSPWRGYNKQPMRWENLRGSRPTLNVQFQALGSGFVGNYGPRLGAFSILKIILYPRENWHTTKLKQLKVVWNQYLNRKQQRWHTGYIFKYNEIC